MTSVHGPSLGCREPFPSPGSDPNENDARPAGFGQDSVNVTLLVPTSPAYNAATGSKQGAPMNKPERLTSAVAAAEFQVGGVIMRRPFRIRRLGHFGVNVADPEKSKDFYCRLLGFRISDPLDFG